MGSALVKYIVELPWGRCQWFSCFFTCEHKAMCVQDMNLKCQVAVMLLGCLECQLSTVLRSKPRNCAESLALGLKLTRHLRGWCVPIITCPWATTMSFLLMGWSRSTGQPVFIFSVFDRLIFQVFWPACCLTSLRVGGIIGGALEEVVRLGWI